MILAGMGLAAWIAYNIFSGGGSNQNPEAGDLLAGGAGVVLATLLFL